MRSICVSHIIYFFVNQIDRIAIKVKASSYLKFACITCAFNMDIIKNWARGHPFQKLISSSLLGSGRQYVHVEEIISGDSIVVEYDDGLGTVLIVIKLQKIACCDLDNRHPLLKEKAMQACNRIFELISDKPAENKTLKQINDDIRANQYMVWVSCKDCYRCEGLLEETTREKSDAGDAKSNDDSEFDDPPCVYMTFADMSEFHKKCETFQTILLREKLAYPYEGVLKTEEEMVAYFS